MKELSVGLSGTARDLHSISDDIGKTNSELRRANSQFQNMAFRFSISYGIRNPIFRKYLKFARGKQPWYHLYDHDSHFQVSDKKELPGAKFIDAYALFTMFCGELEIIRPENGFKLQFHMGLWGLNPQGNLADEVSARESNEFLRENGKKPSDDFFLIIYYKKGTITQVVTYRYPRLVENSGGFISDADLKGATLRLTVKKAVLNSDAASSPVIGDSITILPGNNYDRVRRVGFDGVVAGSNNEKGEFNERWSTAIKKIID